MIASTSLSIALLASLASAHNAGDHSRQYAREIALLARADASTSSVVVAGAATTITSSAAAAVATGTFATPTAGGLIQTTPDVQPNGETIPALAEITANAPTQTTDALYTTVSAGASAPIASAPVIPSFTFVAGVYPDLDVVPPVNSTEVQGWLAELDLTGIPDLGQTNGDCSNMTTAQAESNCWWTCGGCTRDTDITACPDPLTFGLSYDDGPSPYTPLVLDYLHVEDITATFFVVGSRVISRPEMLQLEYADGHQISVHTWSHPMLTTLTNAEIVAELGWTKKAIKDVIGVTPNTMRPPYGDIDDRVRAICKLMGLTPIIWTEAPDGTEFDTDDWKIAGGTATGLSSVAAFDTILSHAASMDTGFIVLEHDLYQQSVDLAVGYILPSVLNSTNPKFNLMSIIDCMGQKYANAYIETYDNTTSSSSNGTIISSTAVTTATTTINTSGLSGSALASATSALAVASSKAAAAASASNTSSGSRSVVVGSAGVVAALMGVVSFLL